MLSNRIMLGGLCVAGLVVAIGAAARADNITTSGVACKNYNASEALDIDYVDRGARNVNASSRWVICPIPRSPFTTLPPNQFFVDGLNNPGATTSCVATLYTYSGTLVSSVSFTQSAPAGAVSPTPWDQAVNFSIAPVTWDYVSVRCFLPGNMAATILGTGSVQP